MTPDPNSTPDPIYDGVVAGDARAIARAISIVENDSAAGAELIGRLYSRTGRAYMVGVTGAPGVGKSTLVDRLTAVVRRAGLSVGIIAVDPTSPFSGGAVLGDRVRMSAHAGDEGVFIRSMATRGHLGGLASATADATLVLDAAGKDVVIIETVGVGQDEVDIITTADVSLVVLAPGAGDEVQAMKAGLMEIADIFVVNKADREGADQVVQTISANLSLKSFGPDDWRPPILKTEGSAGVGLDAVWEAIGRFRERASTERQTRRRERESSRLRRLLSQQLLARVERALPAGEFDRLVDAVTAREIDPYAAVDHLMRRVLPS
ncbi:MAG TPA: methylmalonyl Co-A mutase-associated GTPase MeaB [Vicinamibacterales bacterium]|nr:methylmalonyl Co-A mutase-associated GTPase MeaB [Vicinamibacterales bacterium]